MSMSYHTRRNIRRLLVTLLTLLVVGILAAVCTVLWFQRYMVYTRDGAKLDFSLNMELQDGSVAQPPEELPNVDVYYNEGENLLTPVTTELTKIEGYHITAEMLMKKIDQVREAILQLPAGTTVMLDMKSEWGICYYESSIARISDDVDMKKLNMLLETMRMRGLYLVARIPAFKDYYYAKSHQSHGIYVTGKKYLYAESDRIYWLNPASEGALMYLVQLVSELKGLGFNEVVFHGFRFPDTTEIHFSGDRQQTLAEAAALLAKTCTTDKFAVSFEVTAPTLPLPEGRCRLYMSGVSAAQAAAIAAQTGIEDTAAKLVFVTDLRDTRFDPYSVMRQLKLG